MEQTYRLEVKDYLQYQAFIIKRTPKNARQRRIFMALVPGIVALLLILNMVPLLPSAAIFAVSSLLWILLVQLIFRKGMTERIKMSVGAVGLFTVTITPEMLRVDSPIAETRIRWSKIVEIAESEYHLVFLFSPLVGYIVPKNAFRDSEHVHEFLETARAYRSGIEMDAPTAGGAWPPPPRRVG